MHEYIEFIAEMIDRLLTGQWSVTEFKNAYYTFFLEEIPVEFLSENEWLFYNAIHQSLDHAGGKDEREYICWVENQRQQYLSKGWGDAGFAQAIEGEG